MTRTIETQFLDDSGGKVDIDSWEWLGRNYLDAGLPQNTLSNGLPADRTLSGVPNVLVSPISQHLQRPDDPLLVDQWTYSSNSTYSNKWDNFRVTIAPFSMVQSSFRGKIGEDQRPPNARSGGPVNALVFASASTTTRRIRFDSELVRKIATVKVSTRTATAK